MPLDAASLERLAANRAAVRAGIAEAAARARRNPAEVRLVAVTKKRPPDQVRALVDLGELDLGENYPQELWTKAAELSEERVRWHLIGHLQSNKAKRTLPLVAMIHGVDSLALLQLLDQLAAAHPAPPRVCLQVNCSDEPSKHGWTPAAILDQSDAIAACGRVPVVGLMTMAALEADPQLARPAFSRLRETAERLRASTGLALPELSMGMSNDYEVAVEEGATWVRVGSALFEGIEP